MDDAQKRAFQRRLGRHEPCDVASRGKIFKPFAALKGYYELIDQRSMVPADRRPLTEQECRQLDAILSSLRKGQMVTVSYYDGESLATETGAVRQSDTTLRTLRLMNREIPFDDLTSVNPEGIDLEQCDEL